MSHESVDGCGRLVNDERELWRFWVGSGPRSWTVCERICIGVKPSASVCSQAAKSSSAQGCVASRTISPLMDALAQRLCSGVPAAQNARGHAHDQSRLWRCCSEEGYDSDKREHRVQTHRRCAPATQRAGSAPPQRPACPGPAPGCGRAGAAPSLPSRPETAQRAPVRVQSLVR